MKNPLSSNEFKIMQLLWKENRPLSRPEIIDLTPEKDWNPNSIHLILNNMIEKGDPLGYFMFGGSDIVMIFSEDLDFNLTAEADEHYNMGEEYGRIHISK